MMFKTTAVNNKHELEYKDFFEVTNYLSTDKVDFLYRKTVILEDKVSEEPPGNSLVSFERFDAVKTLSIYNYLKYKLPCITDGAGKKWYSKNICFFEKTLKEINNSTCFITPSDIFIKQVYKTIEYNGDKTVGRLYNFNSINTLPREIRHFLFKDIYVDFDIANAHPSILYLYSEKHGLLLNGSLKRYIKNRHSVMLDVQQELGMDLTSVKKTILTLLNKTWGDTVFNRSKSLSELDEDFQVIRNHLWASYCENVLGNYKQAIHQSVEKKRKVYTSPDGTVDELKLLNLKKVSLQSFYCQTQESAHLIKLVQFLRLKYSHYVKKESKINFTDYYEYTDKKVELGAEHTLFTVPFFDGLYISSPCSLFMADLRNIITDYNKQNKGITFVQKDIEENSDYIPNLEELKKFTVIYTWLGKSSTKYYLDMLLHKKNINEKIIGLLKDKNAFLRSASNKESPDSWDNTYKGIMEGIKSDVYRTLLEYPIKNERDIIEIVKNM